MHDPLNVKQALNKHEHHEEINILHLGTLANIQFRQYMFLLHI